MKNDAFLINTSRGEIVDEEALLSAVRNGTIAGAALDVFGDEPLPSSHPFRHEPKSLATTHVGYVTRETYEVFYGDPVEERSIHSPVFGLHEVNRGRGGRHCEDDVFEIQHRDLGTGVEIEIGHTGQSVGDQRR